METIASKKDLQPNSLVSILPGVGPARSSMLARLGVSTINDLVYLLPGRYLDFSLLADVPALRPGMRCTLVGSIRSVKSRRVATRPLLIWEAELICSTGVISLIWFYATNRPVPAPVRSGIKITAAGVVKANRHGLCLISPLIEKITQQPMQGRIWPVYPTTHGLTQKLMRQWLHCALPVFTNVPDPIPAYLLTKNDLPTLAQTLHELHEPSQPQALKKAQQRLAYEEALTLGLAIGWQKSARQNVISSYTCKADGALVTAFYQALPFALTHSQQAAMTAIAADMESNQVMARLLHGDVGSGKTVIAIYAAIKAIENGYQAVLMVPTRILAEQHFNRWQPLLAKLNVKTSLLTANKSINRSEVVHADIIIGTHALLSWTWPRLGLVIVDEQHRFGVEQRAQLATKGHPHCLYLTATPIPRSIALITCGDLDVTVLNGGPPKRQLVDTRWIMPNQRADVYRFIRTQVAKGYQAFIVYPHVRDDEDIVDDIDEERPTQWPLAAVNAYEQLRKGPLRDLRIGLCHGGLSAAQQEMVTRQFVTGKLQVMVATTVIEVGFDVPNATVMVIEHAERFGLAQLHQLRGRVGRGAARSFCLLVAQARTREAIQRLQALRNSNDGFFLAEQDLLLRGPGELLGVRQSGFGHLEHLILPQHQSILKTAKTDAGTILAGDPHLADANHLPLRQKMCERYPSLWKEKTQCG